MFYYLFFKNRLLFIVTHYLIFLKQQFSLFRKARRRREIAETSPSNLYISNSIFTIPY